MKNCHLLPHSSGIYKITNLINNKCYIGQAKDIYERYFNHHQYDYKRLDYQIYQAMRKYGIENFSIEVLELCAPSELNNKEIYWIEKFDSFHHGYNMTLGGTFLSPKVLTKEAEMKRNLTRESKQSLQDENHPRAKLTNEEVLNIRQRYRNGENVHSIHKDYSELYSFESFQQIVLGDHYKGVGNIPTAKDKKLANSQFTEQDIIDIRYAYYQENATQNSLAKKYNVSQSTIKDIVNRVSYKEVLDNIENNRKRKSYRLTDEEVLKMRKLYSNGETIAKIAQQFKIDWNAVKKCVTYQTYKNIK